MVNDKVAIPEDKLEGVAVKVNADSVFFTAICAVEECQNPVTLRIFDAEFKPQAVYTTSCTGVEHNESEVPAFTLNALVNTQKSDRRNRVSKLWGTLD